MAENTFSIKNYGVFKVRLDSTDITGSGAKSSLYLKMLLRLQMQPVQDRGAKNNYSLIRLAGRISLPSRTDDLLTFEAPPIAEVSNSDSYERQAELKIPLSLRQIEEIESNRAGKDPSLCIHLTGLVAMEINNEFIKLNEITLNVTIPRSHWIDRALDQWAISGAKLLEVTFPTSSLDNESLGVSYQRLRQAEQMYRVGDYAQVLAQLRGSFEALAKAMGNASADRNFFDKLLANSHPNVRERLRDSFDYFVRFLHLGPHEPLPKDDREPISPHDARFALVMSYAVFEYLNQGNWPRT